MVARLHDVDRSMDSGFRGNDTGGCGKKARHPHRQDENQNPYKLSPAGIRFGRFPASASSIAASESIRSRCA